MNFYCLSRKTNSSLYIGLYGENGFSDCLKMKIDPFNENEAQAQALFQLLGSLERQQVKEANVYHMCEGLEWESSPQILSTRRRISRLEKIGMNYTILYSNMEDGFVETGKMMQVFGQYNNCSSCATPLEKNNRVYKGYEKAEFVCTDCDKNKIFLRKEEENVYIISKTQIRKLLKEKKATQIKGNLYQRLEDILKCKLCNETKKVSEFSTIAGVCLSCIDGKKLLVRNGVFIATLDDEQEKLLKENPLIAGGKNGIYYATTLAEEVHYILETLKEKKHPKNKCTFCKEEVEFWKYSRSTKKGKSRFNFCQSCEKSRKILMDSSMNSIIKELTPEEEARCKKSEKIKNKTANIYVTHLSKSKTLSIIAGNTKIVSPNGAMHTCVICSKRKQGEQMSVNPNNRFREWCRQCEDSLKTSNTYIYCDVTGKFLGTLIKKEATKKGKEKGHTISRNFIIRGKDISEHLTPKLKKKLETFKTEKALSLIQDSGMKEKVAVMVSENRVIAYVNPFVANMLLKLPHYEMKCAESIIETSPIQDAVRDFSWLNIIGYKRKQDMPWYIKMGSVEVLDKDGYIPCYISSSVAKPLIDEGMAEKNGYRKIRLLYGYGDFKTTLFNDKLCIYCPTEGTTIEHIRPKSRGGITTFVNCQPACEDCNKAKGNLTIEEIVKLKD